MRRAASLLLLVFAASFGQFSASTPATQGGASRDTSRDDEGVRLPNGKSQVQEILKEDYKKNVKDAQDLIDLAESLKAGLEKNEQHVLSLGDLKKTEEIEKIARRIRGRIRRY